MMAPKKGGLRDRLNAALERANAGRQAKLAAKSDVAYDQGNLKKGAKLDMRSKKVALRSEKRQAVNDAKMNIKMGKLPKMMMKSSRTLQAPPMSSGIDTGNMRMNPEKVMSSLDKSYKMDQLRKAGTSIGRRAVSTLKRIETPMRGARVAGTLKEIRTPMRKKKEE
jgi:hypothetical protein